MKPEKERQHYEALVVLQPNNALAHFQLALLLFDHFAEKDLAREHFGKSLSIYPDSIDAHYHLARVLWNGFENQKLAREHLHYALRLKPNDEELLRFLDFTSMTQKQIFQRSFELRNEVRQQSHPCYSSCCSTHEPAIKSHILQQNGILNHVAEATKAGTVTVEVRHTNYFEEERTGFRYGFYKTGIEGSNELAYWGFCGKCDTKLFANFETKSGSLQDYKNQLLLSYRAHLNELYKQEYNVLFHIALRADPAFPRHVKDIYRAIQIRQACAVLSGYAFKIRLEKAISDPTLKPLSFIYFTLPRVAIATSAIYSIPTRFSVDEEKMLAFRPDYRNAGELSSFDMDRAIVFLHLIPNEHELTVIIGYSELITHIGETPIEQVESLTVQEKFKLISDIIITRLETWCVSPSLYQQWQNMGRDTLILKAINDYLPYERKELPVAINIFEGIV